MVSIHKSNGGPRFESQCFYLSFFIIFLHKIPVGARDQPIFLDSSGPKIMPSSIKSRFQTLYYGTIHKLRRLCLSILRTLFSESRQKS